MKKERFNHYLWIAFIVVFAVALVLCFSKWSTPADSGDIVIQQDILDAENDGGVPKEYKVVVVEGNNQTGYQTFADAMAGIGDGTGDYTVVFVRDYEMGGTDQATLATNGKNAKSFTFSSTYVSSEDTTTRVQAKVTKSINWALNTKTTFQDFDLTTTATYGVNILAYGHELTFGRNMATSGLINVYGGMDTSIAGATMDSTVTNVIIESGKFNTVMGGNLRGTFTGTTDVTIRGNANIATLSAGSNVNGIDDSTSTTGTLTVDGSEGATVKTVTLKVSGVNKLKSVDLYIKNLKDVKMADMKTDNTTSVHVQGDCVVSDQVMANQLVLEDDAKLQIGSNLDLSGDLSLGNSSTLSFAGTGTKSVAGNLIVESGAMMKLYKESATATPEALTVSGAYTTSNPLELRFYKNVAGANGDVLLQFTTEANAKAEDYQDVRDEASATYYVMKKDGGNIVLSTLYQCPSYYQQVDGKKDVYVYDEVGLNTSSDGGSHKVYRIFNRDDTKWYPCDKDGNPTSTTEVNQTKEHPQPDVTYTVTPKIAKTTMIRMDGIGRFKITAAAGTNATGYVEGSKSYGTASGYPSTIVNIDGKGKTNSSWAKLNQTNNSCEIYKAYLVMTTPLHGDSTDDERLSILNSPMTLIGPNGAKMQSNGYLPKGFAIGHSGVGSDDLTSDTPSILIDVEQGNREGSLGEGMTITDVTDFVRKEGYGKYYGVDIPTLSTHSDPDAAIAWRLVVVEEDTSMNYMRKTAIQMGPITSASKGKMEVTLQGFTTPEKGDFGGQILIIGSDNSGVPSLGGYANANVQMKFYPDANDTTTEIKIGTNDTETDVTDRPEGAWSQGIMEKDGKKLASDEVSHMTAAGAMGIDLSLLNVTNTKKEDWETGGGTNLYLTPKSSAIAISTAPNPAKPDEIGYVDTVALSTDIDAPVFETDISHTDAGVNRTEGVDVVGGESVIVKGTASNITPDGSVQGSFNTKVIVTLDDRLTNIRGVEDGDQITAIFNDYDADTKKTTKHEVTGTYNEENHTVVFEFGSQNDEYEDSGLFNDKNDSLEFSFMADTKDEVTINEDGQQYENHIEVQGTFILRDHVVVTTPETAYASDHDDFNTIKNRLVFSKTVLGNGDKDHAFTFTATLKDSDGDLIAEGTELSYRGGVTTDADAKAPKDGTLTVDDKGEVTFQLKHGQRIIIDDIEAGSVVVKESDTDDYAVTWNQGEVNDTKTEETTDGVTPSVKVEENQTTPVNLYNQLKSEITTATEATTTGTTEAATTATEATTEKSTGKTTEENSIDESDSDDVAETGDAKVIFPLILLMWLAVIGVRETRREK